MGTAHAQTTGAPAVETGSSHTSTTTGGAVAAAATVGWNYVHATNCVASSDSVNNWLFVYPAEGGYFYSNSPAFQTVIAPACQAGNWIAFYVDNVNGHWSFILTFAYK